jgi:CheY-like chemotaxis protein
MDLGDTTTRAAGSTFAPKASAVVLVVEDRDVLRDMIGRFLENSGFETLAAASAEEALRRLRERADVALLLTDIGLPALDGWSLAEAARVMRRRLPVVYMSGHASAAWPARGVPGSAFLQKPFALDELADCVSRMVGDRQG